jgi:hypothetical protein
MKMEEYIRAIAGSVVLVTVTLGYFHHRYWLFLTAFVGFNLLQSAFTKWCLMADILSGLGIAKNDSCCSTGPTRETPSAGPKP